jgi:BNR/Asp-box repeat
VSCVSSGTCVAVGGSSIVTTANSGANWSLDKLSIPGVSLLGADCPSATQCLVSGLDSTNSLPGNQAIMMISSNGGSTWSPASLPSGVAGIGSIACPTSTRCIGVGSAVVVSNDGGQTWQTVPVTGGVIELTSITCSSATDCVAVGPNPAGVSNPQAGGDAVVTTDGGTSFSAVALPASSASLFEVACSSATACVAGGGTGSGALAPTYLASTNGGTSWSYGTAPPFTGISGLSCPTSATCVAVGRTAVGPAAAMTSAGQWNLAPSATTGAVFPASAS